MHTKNPSSNPVDERFRTLASAVASQIDAAKGKMTQKDLGNRIGKSNSSVSRDLSGNANLSLESIAAYEVSLDEKILSVPRRKRSSTKCNKRRRRRSEEDRTMPDVREDEVDPVTKRLHRLLTRLSRRITAQMKKKDLTQSGLAERVGKSSSYVSRVLGGGINLTLETIAAFEVALDAQLLEVAGQDLGEVSGSYQTYGMVSSLRMSNDGGYCHDQAGVVTQAVTYSEYLIPTPQGTEENEELQAA